MEKRANKWLFVVLCVCLAVAVAALAVGVVLLSRIARTGVAPFYAVVCAAVAMGASFASLGGVALLWYRLRRF